MKKKIVNLIKTLKLASVHPRIRHFQTPAITRKNTVTPVIQPMVLITQIQRSGGSLLSQLFDDHPECHTHPHELCWGKPEKWNWPDLPVNQNSAKRCFQELWENSIDTFIEQGYYKNPRTNNRELFPFEFDRSLQWEIFLKLFRQSPPTDKRQILDKYLTSFFNAWSDYQNLYRSPKKYVVAFTPRINMQHDSSARFFRDYPHGRMITIVRDPATWYASARQHMKEYKDLEAAMTNWRKSVTASLKLAQRKSRQVLLVLFDPLVTETHRSMRKICDALGLTWDERLCNPTFNGMPIKANSSFEIDSHGILSEPATKRSDKLSSRELQCIRKQCAHLYEAASKLAVNR